MKMSRMFSQTLREAPTDIEIASHQLLLVEQRQRLGQLAFGDGTAAK